MQQDPNVRNRRWGLLVTQVDSQLRWKERGVGWSVLFGCTCPEQECFTCLEVPVDMSVLNPEDELGQKHTFWTSAAHLLLGDVGTASSLPQPLWVLYYSAPSVPVTKQATLKHAWTSGDACGLVLLSGCRAALGHPSRSLPVSKNCSLVI